MSKYEVDMLSVGDADAIFIRYYNGFGLPYIVLIDAGNKVDAESIKKHMEQYYGTYEIELAVCTHPDADHKDGFQELFNDSDINIHEFWYIDPTDFLDVDDLKWIKSDKVATEKLRKVFDFSNEEGNLIDLAKKSNCRVRSVRPDCNHVNVPIKVVAPSVEYYTEIVNRLVEEYVETHEPGDTSKYDEAASVSSKDAKSVIDEDNNTSPANSSSIVLLFSPEKDKKYLFTGDASVQSLHDMIEKYGEEVKNVHFLKVPHHGSKHNLTTDIIDKLSPKISYISAKGSRKHPNKGVVYWLRKHGDVFSTHQSGLIWNHNNTPYRLGFGPIPPLN